MYCLPAPPGDQQAARKGRTVKCVTCSLRNNLTQDSAHSRNPCNIPAERKDNRVKCLRDMRDTDRYNDRFTNRQTDRQIFAEIIDRLVAEDVLRNLATPCRAGDHYV